MEHIFINEKKEIRAAWLRKFRELIPVFVHAGYSVEDFNEFEEEFMVVVDTALSVWNDYDLLEYEGEDDEWH